MKKQVFFLLAATSLMGCQKVIRYEESHPGVVSLCSIESFNLVLGGQNIPQTVTYNKQGNPVTVFTTTTGEEGDDHNLYFRYDKYNRVTDFEEVLLFGTTPEVWHRFSYPRKNIAIDSEFAYDTGPTNAPNPEPSSFQGLTIDSFDNEGRILRAGYGATDPVYVYDARGNDINNGYTAYDDKINPYRTNYTWMFVFHSFSTNNPLADSITSYDQDGLPLGFRNATLNDYFGLNFDSMTVNYSCSVDQKK